MFGWILERLPRACYVARIVPPQPQSRFYTCVIFVRWLNFGVTVGQFSSRGYAVVWAKDCIQRRAWIDSSELPDTHG